MYRHYFNIERKQLQWQSEHHQAQQETPRTQNQAYRKSPHRLHVQAQFRGQAHRHKANRSLPHQGVTHSHVQRRQQSRHRQRHQLQRQAQLHRKLSQKLRRQKLMHLSEHAVQTKQKRHSQHHRETTKDGIHLNFLQKMLKKA